MASSYGEKSDCATVFQDKNRLCKNVSRTNNNSILYTNYMVRNEVKYEQAVSLRKRGFTLEEIAKYCDISKSTASKWLKNKAFSEQVSKQNAKRAGVENAKRLRLISKARSKERVARYKEAVHSAETEFKHYRKDQRFIAGLMLYLVSGDMKNERVVRFSGSKMDSHKIFLKFALEYLGVEKTDVRFMLFLQTGQNEELCMKKWHRSLGLPYAQFYKNQVLQNKTTKKTLHSGVGNTIIGSTVLKSKLSRWVELATKELSS